MNWTKLLTAQVEANYAAATGLISLCKDKDLGWTPASGANWMSEAQLLEHITSACGLCMDCFVKGEWPMLECASQDDMLPPASKLPAAKSVAAAKRALAKDKKLALAAIKAAGEKALSTKKVSAPWNPTKRLLGEQLLFCVEHLQSHKSQLFYYLKLQGKPVHTGHLYGM